MTVHGLDVLLEGHGELMRVDVFLEDGKHLVEELLLVEVVELQGGVHLVDHGVLVDKSGKLSHDFGNKSAIVAKSDMNMVTLNNLLSPVHAHMELDVDSIELDHLSSVGDSRTMRNGLTSSGMSPISDGSLLLVTYGLNHREA